MLHLGNRILLITCIILFFYKTQTFAQVDTEFWFVAPEVADSHGDEPILLRLSALDQLASVTISQPANSAFTPITVNITPNETTTLNLTSRKDLLENQPANLVLTKGIKIVSSTPITAYYEVANAFNPEIFTLKGRSALGQDFYIPSQNTFRNQEGSEAFDIVATENNTEVNITPSINIIGRPAGVEFTIILQEGETFSARAIETVATASLAGSKVTSNRPIAITVNDDSVFLEGGFIGGWDLIGDQIVPTNLLGTEHIVTEGFSGIGENVYILAVEDNTNLFIAGALVATLNAGETYRHDIVAPSTFIESSKPVYVWHLSGHPIELGSALVPHLNCTGSQRMNFIRSNTDDFALILLTKNGNQGNFTFNGTSTLIDASDFNIVPNTAGEWVVMVKEYSTSEIPVDQAHILQNSTGLFHLGILNKLGESSEYGYFSDFTSVNLGDDIQSCTNETVILDAGVGRDSYLWSNGATTQTISVGTAGEYWVEITKLDCTIRDTVQVDFLDVPTLNFGDFTREYCFNDTPVIPTASSSDAGVGRFQINNQVISQIRPAQLGAGSYELLYIFENSNNCSDTISTDITVYASPALFFMGLEDTYCNDVTTVELAASPVGGVFQLDGNTENITTISPVSLNSGLHEIAYIYTHPFTSCVDTLIQQVTILQVPSPEFVALPTNLCSNDPAFNLSAVPSGGIFEINNVVSTELDPSALGVGSYQVTYSYSDGNCETTINQTITINPSPQLSIKNIKEGYCIEDAAFAIEVEPIGGNIEINGVNTNVLNPRNLGAGTHIISYAYINPEGCPNQIFREFTIVDAPPSLSFPSTKDSIFMCPANRRGILLSVADSQYVTWSTGDTTSSINIKEGGTYIAKLSNGFGCDLEQVFEVYERCQPEFSLPNAFSPNGDGLNDVFQIIGGDLFKLDFRIYNRWGEVVYYSYQVEEAWDGTLRGKPVPEGIYIWRARYENILEPSKVYEKKGKVTVVR